MKEPRPMTAVVAPGRPWALCVDEQAASHVGLSMTPLYRGEQVPQLRSCCQEGPWPMVGGRALWPCSHSHRLRGNPTE